MRPSKSKSKDPKPKFNKNEDSEEEDDSKDTIVVKGSLSNTDAKGDVTPITQFHPMGDRVFKEKPPSQKKQARPENRQSFQPNNAKYEPLTKESRSAFEEMMGLVNLILPDQTHDLVYDCTVELISLFKNDQLSDRSRKDRMAEFISLNDDKFLKLKALCQDINDYHKAQTEADETINVVLDGQQETKEDLGEEVNDPEADDPSGDDEETTGARLVGKELMRSLLSSNRRTLSPETEDQLFQTLGLQNEVDLQNELYELESTVGLETIGQLMQNRHLIYYGQLLIENSHDQHHFQQVLDRIRNNDQAYHELRHLIGQTVKSFSVFTHSPSEQSLTLSERIEALDLDSLVRCPKQIMHLAKRTEELLSFAGTALRLPSNSKKVSHKGYEEVTIPHSLNSTESNEKLLKIDAVPVYFREAFGDLKSFNRIQSKVFRFAFDSTRNMLLCAPTGAGKTVVSLIAILGLLDSMRDPVSETLDLSKVKIVYLAPMKALVSEVVSTMNVRLSFLHLTAAEYTGDVHLSSSQFQNATIIVSTPEKWDVLSRKSLERNFEERLRLVIADEIHLLGDSRGPVLESVLVRTMSRSSVRVVGLSATLPNYEDVARFLRVDPTEGLFYFNNSFRPVPLEQVYVGVSEKSGVKRLAVVREVLFKTVLERVKDFQMLVFVHSRKETLKTALELKESAFAENVEELFVQGQSKAILEGIRGRLLNGDLQAVIDSGIGFHHAGLSRGDRKYVEDLFANGHLSVLVSTATLAWGVNLPAHTVIVKNTQVYSPEQGKWVSLSTQNLWQMLGRAGRPAFDKEGEGVVITSANEMRHYISHFNEQDPIESSLLSSLSEAINAEIVSGSIHDLKDAIQWVSKTYFFQRLRRNPQLYGLRESGEDESRLLAFVLDAVHSAAVDLEAVGLVRYHREKGLFESTPEGRIASYFYVKPENMKMYSLGIETELNEIDLLGLFANSVEFRQTIVRDEEKAELARLYSIVPIPIKAKQDDPKSKVNVLLQCYISRIDLEGYALSCDLKFVAENAQRIFRALMELSVQKKSPNCLLILEFCKVIERRVWRELSPIRQLAKLPEKVLMRIEQQEHLSFENIRSMSFDQLNSIVKADGQSRLIMERLRQFPKVEVGVVVQVVSRSSFRISLSYACSFEWNDSLHGNRLTFRVVVFEGDMSRVFFARPFVVHKSDCARLREERLLEFTVHLGEPFPPHLFVRVVSDSWLHCETTLPVSLGSVVLPSKLPLSLDAPSESEGDSSARLPVEVRRLLGLQSPNPMQKQLAEMMYSSFNSCFIGSVGNGGKFTLALIGLSRLFEETKSSKAVILFSNRWKLKRKLTAIETVCTHFDVSFDVLSGNMESDLAILNNKNVVVSMVDHFEQLTRNYNKRVALKQVRMVIATDVSSVGSPNSPYELLLTRLRFVFAQLDQKHRLVALSPPIANFSSICDWLGIEPGFAFNYHKSYLNNTVNTLIHPIDAIQSENFVSIASKKMTSILRLKETRQQSFLVVVESDEVGRQFGGLLCANLASLRKDVDEGVIGRVRGLLDDGFNNLFVGVGLLCVWEGMATDEVDLVVRLFNEGIVQYVVVGLKMLDHLADIDSCNTVVVDGGVLGEDHLSRISALLNRVDHPSRSKGDRQKSPQMHPRESLGSPSHDDPRQSLDTQSLGEVDSQPKHLSLIVFLRDWEKEDFRHRFLESSIVESQLASDLVETFNTELSAGTIKQKQQFVDWMTWSYFYRRLAENPNYYNLSSNDHALVSEYMSELIEAVLSDLEKHKCIEVTAHGIQSEPNGLIASLWSLRVSTVSLLSNSIAESFGWKTLFNLMASSSEFGVESIGRDEMPMLEELSSLVPIKVPSDELKSGYFKVFVLLQSYLTRQALSQSAEGHLSQSMLPSVLRILNGVIDVSILSTSFKPALLAMKLHQLVIQRMWISDSSLKQLPHFDDSLVSKSLRLGVTSITDFLFSEDHLREELIAGLSDDEKTQVVLFANSLPNVEFSAVVVDKKPVYAEGDEVEFVVSARNDVEEGEESVFHSMGLVRDHRPHWWLLFVDKNKGLLFLVKKVLLTKPLNKKFKVQMGLPGQFSISVLLISDSCIGFDGEINPVDVEVVSNSDEGDN